MKICFAASECYPYVKTGGLADVSGALPIYLKKEENDIKIFLPLYDTIDIEKHEMKKCSHLTGMIMISGMNVQFDVYHSKLNLDIDVYFIKCDKYFARGKVYTDDEDEGERFGFFQHAIIKILQVLQWSPDIFHCNDWQTALIPALLKYQYSWDKLFENSSTILTIHNIGYQGIFDEKVIYNLGFEKSLFVLGGPFEYNKMANFLKAGIYFANIISTVSPTYAKEIQTPEYGSGLDGVIRSRSDNVVGILNGIDNDIWNPEKDTYIIKQYTAESISDKYENKKHLLKFANFQYEENVPLFGIISRLAWQKGFELIIEVLRKRISEKFYLIVLGTGEAKYEKAFAELEEKYPEKIKVFLEYNNELSHKITASSDFFLMPSRYEPCGLNQMYSLNYGTLPIVRKTGGLADTVIDVSESNGYGFVFEEFDTAALDKSIQNALEYYNKKSGMIQSIKRAMALDFSWGKSAREYILIYNKIKNHN